MDSRYLEIVRLLIDTAPFVFTQECFALKGGTAINLFLEDMPRLSVDIDLVYTNLEHSDRVSALAVIEKSLHAVAELLESKLGVTVRPTTSGSEHESKLFISRGPVLLKVEVNHVFRGAVFPLVIGTMSAQAQKRFSRALSVPMLDPDELYASKLVAAMDRQHPRDLFDVLLLLERGGITPRIRRAFTVYLAGHNRPIHELLSPNPKDIRTEFESDFVGMANREVSIEQLVEVRERIFQELPASLDESERSFLLSVNRREPDWEILGLPGIEKLPALRWKLLNLGKLAKSNPSKYTKILNDLEDKFQLNA
jgi:predicted nucleotidyltransferase component of viral defense system